MATPAMAGPASPPGDTGAHVRSSTHPAVHAARSALLLWVCFPPLDWGWLAWCALVPLFLLVGSRRRARSIYLGAWLGGMLFWTLAIQWVRLADSSSWAGWLLMAFALSWFWPAFVGLTRWGVGRLGLPLMVAAPLIWVGLEYVRGFYLSGFPWYYLAHSQHGMLPLIQVSDLTGSLGVSFLIALVNAWLVDLLSLPLVRTTPRGPRLAARQTVRLVAVALLVASTLGYGAYRLSTSRFSPGPRIALLQSSVRQFLKSGGDPNDLVEIYRRLTERALAAPERPDLVVWPETSYPFAHAEIGPDVTDADLDRQLPLFAPKFKAADWRSRSAGVSAHLHSLADLTGVPALIGVVSYHHLSGGYSKSNSALLFEPGQPRVQEYRKMHLVPFGEYVPLVRTFPWLWMLTPYERDSAPSLTPGTGPSWFDLGPYRLAAAICFEDTVPRVARRFFREAPGGREPDVLLNLSNDGWFGASSEHEMHLAASVFRAVELRVPLARAANTGISAILDGNGRTVRSLGTLKEGVVADVVPLDSRTSLYTAWGDWLGLGCLAITIGLVPIGFFYPKHRTEA